MTCKVLLVYSWAYHLGTIALHSVYLVESLNQTQMLLAPSILSSTGRPKSPCVANTISLRHFSLYTHNHGVIRNIYTCSIVWTFNHNICKVDKTINCLNSLCLAVCDYLYSFFKKANFQLTIVWFKHVKLKELNYTYSVCENHITKTFVLFGYFFVFSTKINRKAMKIEDFLEWVQIQDKMRNAFTSVLMKLSKCP